ncbi:two-component sensor histidine kinase [Bacillus sp. V3B]|uniref:ATP-binding protein n=1 Tax=Bacillus sp. V3B TaxID=2804915 RepID=UPI00210AE3A6|nr:ATP-binding protein [Bacillus sp. V3B]MCQ6277087.1 two-component sensor histidine kinase [Bacillus sp. V3B]
MIETLLLNFLILLIPVLTFLIFFENKLNYVNKPILAILTAISMVLCITFPIYLESGFIFDLRYIPFVIAALFGGYKYAFPLYIVLNVYRFIIGVEGVIQSFLFSSFIFALVPLYSKKFIQLDSRYRISFAAFVSFFTMAVYLFTLGFQTPLNQNFWTLSFYALTTHLVMTAILMFLIEQIIANRKARETLLQSDRLQLVSELSASVAHEIRNPLTATNGFLQLLSQSESIPMKEKNYIKFSLQELNRAEQIVSDFLAFSKPQSENMINSDLKEETEYARNVLLPYAHMHHVDIQLTFHNSLHTNYDKNQIQQCLINLYKNGIEAMKEDGGILYIDVSEYKHNIMIQIKDTGIGMTKEEVSRLGKPYYSTKEYGTGLGMLMVYSAIHKVRGQIRVESEKEKGSTFTITIPV